MRQGKLHVVSTGRQNPERFVTIMASIHPYIDAVHMREKAKTASELYELVRLLQKKGVPLSKIIINDRVDVAWATGVKGVQLAYHSLPVAVAKRTFPGLEIGCSVHSIEEARFAEEQGADYLVFGHVFSTRSKPGLSPKGLAQVGAVTEATTIPVFGIGGITPDNAVYVVEAGAAGIAVMSGILEAEDPLKTVQEYYSRLAD